MEMEGSSWGVSILFDYAPAATAHEVQDSLFFYSPEAYAKGSHRLLCNSPVVTFCPDINTNKYPFHSKKCLGLDHELIVWSF